MLMKPPTVPADHANAPTPDEGGNHAAACERLREVVRQYREMHNWRMRHECEDPEPGADRKEALHRAALALAMADAEKFLADRHGFITEQHDTTTTPTDGDAFERPVERFDPSKLHETFSNVQLVPDDRFTVYRVLDQYGSEAAMLSHLGGNEWRAFVDNFPGRKKFFSWNLPALTLDEFEADVKRTGLRLAKPNAH